MGLDEDMKTVSVVRREKNKEKTCLNIKKRKEIETNQQGIQKMKL